jgi:hypothetical protein
LVALLLGAENTAGHLQDAFRSSDRCSAVLLDN